MKTTQYKKILIPTLLIFPLLLSGCGVLGAFANIVREFDNPEPTAVSKSVAPAVTPMAGPETSGALETIQAGFNAVYEQVLPSVVNIRVVKVVDQGMLPETREFPFPFPFQLPDEGEEFRRSGLGSGFVWDREGHIVTNNHVVEGADEITVTFHDGTSVDGEVVGSDRDSDLALVKVDYPEDQLQPVQVGDSTQVKVGQLVAAIGNPFGLQGTMTVGVISALGRSLPVGASAIQSPTYTIPDVIQTDAPINPGNSGGVLVDMNSQLIGVPTAIESSSGVNAGVGFVVPSVIVQKVVPALVEQGFYEHPWIGIRGTTLNSDMAEEIDLPRDQRGVLVVDVTPDSPAEAAGLIGSDRLVSIDDQEIRLGGDVIIQIGSQPTRDFEDLTAYLARHTEAGQTVSLTVLRDGREVSLDLTLGVRPTAEGSEQVTRESQDEEAWLGIYGLSMSPNIAEAMNMDSDQSGVLIQQVIEDSPADQAGLRGSYKSITLNGQQVLVGGDTIVALDDQVVEDMTDLQVALSERAPDDEVVLTFLRDGDRVDAEVVLGERP
jgi:S1-C subfamily serine protease